ncbi:MAG: nucleotidyltransferase domain-containing protein [Paraclostridium sp.]
MNIVQNQLRDLLKVAIRGKKSSLYLNKEEILNLLEESERHKVKGLIYTGWDKDRSTSNISDDTVEAWKKSTIMTGIRESRQMKNVGFVLKKIQEQGIDTIVLKGLVLRDLYPIPDQRTMNDADILVKREDIDKTKKILLDLGFEEGHDSCHHVDFYNPSYGKVELHWQLIDESYFRGDTSFEDEIWHRTIPVNVGGTTTLSLGWEDLLLHSCAHMASHMARVGFGIRYLCDLVVILEHKSDEICWDNFMKLAKQSKVDRFVCYLFAACNKLFNMEVPSEVLDYIKIDDRCLDELINSIYESGVHGKRNLVDNFMGEVVFDKEESAGSDLGIVKRFLGIIFPPIDKMSDKYDYAKKNKVLVPIAWIHHLVAGVFNKDYNFFDKVKFFISTISISKKKDKMLKELNL